MKTIPSIISVLALSTGLYAEEPHSAKIVNIEAKLQPTPDYQAKGPSSKKVEVRDWIEIEAEVLVHTSDPSGYIPELKVNWYAAVKDKVKKKTTGHEFSVKLMGDSTYKNISTKNGKVYLSAYIEPRVLERYLGDSHIRLSDFTAFAMTLSGEGLKVDEKTKQVPFMSTVKTGGAWWDNWKYDYLVESIRSKSKTPFSMMWIDRYPAEKVVQ